MAILDTITHSDLVERHRPWQRALVGEEGWRQAMDHLAARRLALLGLWGDAPEVHMALLDEETSDLTVISYTCKSGKYPSVAARHPPAIRLERAIRDLFGLDAVDTLDARPWLDLGFWDVHCPLGKQDTASRLPLGENTTFAPSPPSRGTSRSFSPPGMRAKKSVPCDV